MPLAASSSALAIFVVLGLGLVIAPSAQAHTVTVLHPFNPYYGAGPIGSLVQATNGDLYGVTLSGGVTDYNDEEDGSVFKITPSGVYTSLYSFCAQSGCTDGKTPQAGLVLATNGDLYGTTTYGGANNGGTVFKMTPSGTLTTLYNFCSQKNDADVCLDGEYSIGALIQSKKGTLYGVTPAGGANSAGTVYKITETGTLTTVYNFCSVSQTTPPINCVDGAGPQGALVEAADGNFYGTTANGGESTLCSQGCGTVFKLTSGGALTTIYNFCLEANCPDGYSPEAALTQGTNGNLYGTTPIGGANGDGTVFEITSGGALTTLYSFCAQTNCADGSGPGRWAGLLQGTDGNFYGTTQGGGAHLAGTIFNISPGGTLTTLYSFCSDSDCADGEDPFAGLVQDTNGKFYGSTTADGANEAGTIYKLVMGLQPFVKTLPTSGKVGAAVKILGTMLTTANSVTFNGTPATFTVSASEIKTTVPTGATTGIVEVTTSDGTLKSNAVYTVTP
jgi:uncharacterized repeat protein (TIGR03803 family)